MSKPINIGKKKVIFYGIVIGLLLVALSGCNTREKIFTIGIVSSIEPDHPICNGFYKGMVEAGYIEGKNLKYIVKKVTENNDRNIDAAIKELLNQNNIDLLLTLGKEVDLRAKELVKGSKIPVLIGSGTNPSEIGLIKSISHPGGNLTGVQGVDCMPKALEFLKVIIPDLKKVYVPYNPDDIVSNDFLPGLNKAASNMGIELILHEIHSVEETITAIENLNTDVDAILMIPSPTLNARNNELSKAAIKRRLPMGAGLLLDKDVLVTYTNDFFNIGQKMARLAKEIFNGLKPADLPIETAEVELTINLKTAEKIGVYVPEGLLAQARIIIR
jgi:putative tryptophan/tyrosine transport system substrate-binding protein